MLAVAGLLAVGCTGTPAVDADITLGEYYIGGPASLPAGSLTLKVHNVGHAHHALSICEAADGGGCAGTSLEMQVKAKPQQARDPDSIPDRTSALLLGSDWEYLAEVTLVPGAYRFFCGLINHPERGMERTITVTDPQA